MTSTNSPRSAVDAVRPVLPVKRKAVSVVAGVTDAKGMQTELDKATAGFEKGFAVAGAAHAAWAPPREAFQVFHVTVPVFKGSAAAGAGFRAAGRHIFRQLAAYAGNNGTTIHWRSRPVVSLQPVEKVKDPAGLLEYVTIDMQVCVASR